MVNKNLTNLRLNELDSFRTLPTPAQINIKENKVASQHFMLTQNNINFDQLIEKQLFKPAKAITDRIEHLPLVTLPNFFLPNPLLIRSELNTNTKSW